MSLGLAARIWTRDLSTAHKVAQRIKAGSVGVNMHGTLDSVMPFGGYKQSGLAPRERSRGARLYTETKAVVMAL
jgi:phenylacetaldehyde dehydrogenase